MEEYTQLTLDLGQYTQEKEEIKKDLGGIVKSFVRVGWHLWRINRSEAYKMDGYSSIAEFAKAEYGMTPSGVSRFIEVYERYSDEGDTPELKEQYRDFKYPKRISRCSSRRQSGKRSGTSRASRKRTRTALTGF